MVSVAKYMLFDESGLDVKQIKEYLFSKGYDFKGASGGVLMHGERSGVTVEAPWRLDVLWELLRFVGDLGEIEVRVRGRRVCDVPKHPPIDPYWQFVYGGGNQA